GFPFNVMRDPMYNGSTLCFLGSALWYRSPAGLVLSSLVYIVYSIALTYEGPFTDMIYSKRAAKSE
ncbi:Phosphatidyl-N-methylethanolamine N-methyltransferase, partial [Tulasnella sp. 417]